MKSLNKVLDILETFLADDNDELRLSELAELTGLHRATVNRIVSTLVARGYLRQMEKRGKYSLGIKFFNYNTVLRSRIKIADIAKPHLIKLNSIIKESTNLFTYDHGQAMFIEEIYSNYPLRIIPGRDFPPFYCTSIGKIYLSNISETELEEYFENEKIKTFTPKTITDINVLKKQLLSIRTEGIAYDDEEWTLGVRSIAAGIRDVDSKLVGAVSILGPTVRLTRDNLLAIAPDVKYCAMKISLELGYINPAIK